MMLERHARYVPVMDGTTLQGVVSFHDVAKAVYEEQSFENRMLKSYIKDWPDAASGAVAARRPRPLQACSTNIAGRFAKRAEVAPPPRARRAPLDRSPSASVRSTATHTRVAGAQRRRQRLQHRRVAVRRLDEELRARRCARESLLRARAAPRARSSARHRQVAVEREALAVHARRHQREQDRRRSDQRHDAHAARRAPPRPARAGIGDARAAGIGEQPDVVARARRREQRRAGAGVADARAAPAMSQLRDRHVGAPSDLEERARRLRRFDDASGAARRATSIVRAGSTSSGRRPTPSRFGTR